LLFSAKIDTFWFVHSACSVELQNIQWKNGRDSELTDNNITTAGDDKSLMMYDNIGSSFFKLTLLTRCTEVGLLYGPKTNYRLASKDKMTVKNRLRKSMLEYALSSGNENEFNPKMSVAFYQIEKSNDSKNAVRLTSIAKETVKLTDTVFENCQVHIDEASVKHVSNFELLKLCYILKEKPTKKRNGSEYSEVYDYRTILNGQGPKTINNNDDLKTYVHNNLDWRFFKVKTDLSVHENIWRVRSFFQVLTGVGISIVEGGHRMTLTAKLLTGMTIDDEIPFVPGQDKRDVIIPVDSPIWGKATVQVLTTRKDASKRNSPYALITQKELDDYQNYSQRVAEQKTHFIESTWKDWIGETVKKIQQHTKFNKTFNEIDFSKLKEPHPPKNDDKYILNYRLVIQAVAACLFDLLPARRLALTAMTYAKSKREKPKPVEKDTFIEQATEGKKGNYTHDCWAGVSNHGINFFAIKFPSPLTNAALP
jgi:hypothetical protein